MHSFSRVHSNSVSLRAEMIRRKRQKIAIRMTGKAYLSQNLINQRQMRTTCQGTSFLCTCNPSRVSGVPWRRTPHSTLHVGRLDVNLPSEEMLPSIYHFDNLNYHRSLYDNRSNILSVQFHNCLPKHLKVWSHSVDVNEPQDGASSEPSAQSLTPLHFAVPLIQAPYPQGNAPSGQSKPTQSCKVSSEPSVQSFIPLHILALLMHSFDCEHSKSVPLRGAKEKSFSHLKIVLSPWRRFCTLTRTQLQQHLQSGHSLCSVRAPESSLDCVLGRRTPHSTLQVGRLALNLPAEVYDNPPNTLSEQFQNYLSNCLEVQSHSVDVTGPPGEDHFLFQEIPGNVYKNFLQ
uniref:Uncharacterized protein n=1 Tax=Glossina palpalis gambiensis TaxID=67801 RepID=A0A1B0C3U7_9MUSC